MQTNLMVPNHLFLLQLLSLWPTLLLLHVLLDVPVSHAPAVAVRPAVWLFVRVITIKSGIEVIAASIGSHNIRGICVNLFQFKL